ncbi:MAG: hypothetical protein IKI29_02005 [Clostridia bacterium]|nr:hypothetical protein [Clostridia bacterium]
MKKLMPMLMSIVAVIAGVVFIIAGIHSLATKDLYDSTVTATVVDVQEEWDNSDPDDSRLVTTVFIDYEIDGVKYEHVESPESNSGMKIGDKVEILYQSKDPSKISAKNITTGAIIFIVVGALLAIGGVFATVKSFIRG